MDDFLVQFLAQAWRGVAIIVGLLVLAFFVARRNERKKQEDIRRRKEAQNPQLLNQSAQSSTKKSRQKSAKKARSKQALPSSQTEFADELSAPEPQKDEFFISSKGSIFDDEDFFPAEDDETEEDEISVSMEAEPIAHEAVMSEEPAPLAESVDEEDDAVDLASLLAGMAENDASGKSYHRITDDLVAVKLATKNLAIGKELLSISRDKRDSRLMVQIGDNAYRTLLGQKETKKFFTDTMRELSGIILTPDNSPPVSADITGITPNTMSTEAIDVEVASGGDTTAREMISIIRDKADGHLIIQIGNTGYRTLVNHPKAKAGFSKIMKELSTVITTEDNNPPAVVDKVPSMPLTATQSNVAVPDDENEEALPGDIRVASMDEMPDAYKVGRFGRVKVKKIEEKVEEINIAEAIEAYLQYKIQQQPQFKNRGIHIRSAFGGGVRIEVEGKSYEFVDEVAQEDAREFIKQAIAEWQERH